MKIPAEKREPPKKSFILLAVLASLGLGARLVFGNISLKLTLTGLGLWGLAVYGIGLLLPEGKADASFSNHPLRTGKRAPPLDGPFPPFSL